MWHYVLSMGSFSRQQEWITEVSLQWRHNEHHSVSNHQSLDCLLIHLFSRTWKIHIKNSASLAFVRGIHWWPVDYPHKWPVTRKIFPFYDVVMWRSRCLIQLPMQPTCFNIGWIIFTTMTSNERHGVSDHWQLGCLFKPSQTVSTRSKCLLAVCHIWIFRRNYCIQAERDTLKQMVFLSIIPNKKYYETKTRLQLIVIRFHPDCHRGSWISLGSY